ncbi:MAG TPA: hypothetical protein VHU86_10270 [Solirubrobacterales bacterium]|nr:hypothetical protein [Solirubrobacterales bacterium]
MLDAADIQGEAAEDGLAVTQREYQHFVHSAKLTEEDLRERVKLQLLARLIEDRITRGIHGYAAQQEAFSKFVKDYSKRWKARTVCAPRYATGRCSNGPSAETVTKPIYPPERHASGRPQSPSSPR